jgi:putative lipoic acid-binding regulatory protein
VTQPETPLLAFPCELPIKVFGRNEQGFRDAALAIVRAHYDEWRLAEQQSRQGSYLSLTITVRAESRAQIDAMYRDLVASDEILMVI